MAYRQGNDHSLVAIIAQMATLADTTTPATFYSNAIEAGNERNYLIENEVAHRAQIPMRLNWFRQHVLLLLQPYDEPDHAKVPNEINAWLLRQDGLPPKHVRVTCTSKDV